MADIFLSYHRDDRAIAQRLASTLEQHGYSVWWDTALASGQQFRNQIETELDAARAVVVLWSRASIMSSWVFEEADHAQRHSKLLQIAVDETLPPLGFRSLQTLRLGQADDPNTVVALLAALTAREIRPSEAVEKKLRPDSDAHANADKIFEEKPEDARAAATYVDTFIAYSRVDTQKCEDLIIQLRYQELDVFYDQFIRGGEEWRDLIAKNIIGCAVFVVILSQSSIASQEVKNEINLAIKHNKKIIPILIEPISLPGAFELMLSGLNYVNAYEDPAAKFREAAETAKTEVALGAFDARRKIAQSRSSLPTAVGVDTQTTTSRGWSAFWYALTIGMSLAGAMLATVFASARGLVESEDFVVAFGAIALFVTFPYSIFVITALRKLANS